MLTARRIARTVSSFNQRVNGGAVVLHVQQVLSDPKWRVSIEMVSRHRPFNIANGYNLRTVLRDAARFLDECSGPDGIFQVAPYLEGDEYARWCDPLGRKSSTGPARRL